MFSISKQSKILLWYSFPLNQVEIEYMCYSNKFLELESLQHDSHFESFDALLSVGDISNINVLKNWDTTSTYKIPSSDFHRENL